MASKNSIMLIIFVLILLTFISTNEAESHAELYWKNKVGNIPMPKTLKDSLQTGFENEVVKMNQNYKHNSANDEDKHFMYTHPISNEQLGFKNAFVKINKNYIHNSANDEDKHFMYSHPASNEQLLGLKNEVLKINENYKHNFANDEDKHFMYTHPMSDELSENEVLKLKENYKHNSANDEDKHFMYSHPALDEQLVSTLRGIVKKSKMPQNGRLVYFKNDTLSRVGTKMKLHFQKIDNEAKFLPLNIAKYIPSASDKLQMILNLFSVNPKSIAARDIEITMKTCEEKGVKDEKRYCATSLEGMVDYVTSILNFGKNKLTAVSTEQENGIFMEYTIQKVQKLGKDNSHNVVCHKMSNPYVVFLCHDIKSTDLYSVSLVDVDGNPTKVIAVCHKDTSSWNPNTYALEFLKSKPGSEPVCHFISANAVVWF